MTDARILVTGSTGLVGFELLDVLRGRGCTRVVGASRHGGDGAVAWDIGAEPPPRELEGEWDVVVNSAADTRWTLAPDDARRANVATVEALAALGLRAAHVVHVSTAYAARPDGSSPGVELEAYRNTYEWSKALAERRARELFPRLTIVRPPLIMGRRSDGRAARFMGMYTVIRGISSSLVPAIVGSPDAFFDVIPVDDLAHAIATLAGEPAPSEPRVVTVAGGPSAPTVDTAVTAIVDTLNEWRTGRGLEPVAKPRLVAPASWNRFFLPFARKHLTDRQLKVVDLLSNYEPYLQLHEPLAATSVVPDAAACIPASVRYWADEHSRIASLSAKPWRAAA
jgi:nucleoside-diphosphate-sugar epimerase